MIEKPGKTTANPMAEDDAEAPDTGGAQPDEQGQTVEIPLAALAGQTPNPGDVVRLKVVSVDQNQGIVNAVYDQSGGSTPSAKGSDALAADFNKPQPQM
jgi:exosome complex RNA-binding protein Csl4